METWNIFYGNDVVIGLLGALGFISMLVVISSASSKVDKRERVLREASRALSDAETQEETEDAFKYDTSSK
jgi:hypothetical protein